MLNKLLHQQLKNTIRGLKEQQLDETLKLYEQAAKLHFDKVCKMVSYKCYEASILCKGKKANGYGRNEEEATANCIKNLFEFLMEDEGNVKFIMQALKKDQSNGAGNADAENATTTNASNTVNTNAAGHGNYRMPPRMDKVNNTFALNLSAIHQNGDTSFDMKGDIETLSKNIGNISMINNSKIMDNNNNPNVSQLEMDDLILKMMLENPEKAKNFKEMTSSPNLNTQTSNSNFQYGNSFGPSLKKTNPPGVDSRLSETKKVVLAENTTVQNQGRFSYSKSLQVAESATEPVQKQMTLGRNNSFNKENNQENENRDVKTIQRSNSSLNRSGSIDTTSFHKLPAHDSFNKTKCTCSATEELAKAKAKIDSLEKKIKLLLDENKALKYLSTDKDAFKSTDGMSNTSTQLPSHHKSAFETMTNTSTTQLPSHHKSTYEKTSSTRPDASAQPENFDSTCENIEKQPIKYTEKQRSQSVDIYSKRKAMSSTDVLGDRPDIKKMIPRLRLDMLPNYHAKNYKGNPSPVPSLNLNATTLNSTNTNNSSKQSILQQTMGNPFQGLGSSSLAFSQTSVNNTSLQKLLAKK